MHKTFERKMNQSEFKNLTENLSVHFKTELGVLDIFTKMMTFGAYCWQDKFRNKLSLVYSKTSDLIMQKRYSSLYDDEVIAIIDKEEGEDKQFFLFRNYHNSPQMWRLNDMKAIWGIGIHSSYKLLQPHYLNLCKQLEEDAKRNKEQKAIDNLKSFAASFIL
jgi:hypothetical protein